MPLINADIKSLEVYTAADWYDDEILKDELLRQLDLHSINQERFKLPDRVTAKRFIFKLLYGATDHGYANDPDFFSVGYSKRQWQKIIDEFYTKYPSIGKGHLRDIKFVKENGYLEIPSGRYFPFNPSEISVDKPWTLTKIKNYPIQGFGADLVKLGRIEAFNRFKESGLEGEFICTIHDSLVYDVPEKNVDATVRILRESIDKVPELCYTNWNWKFSLPLLCEISVGPNKFDMVEV